MELKDYVRIVLAHWVGVLVLAVAGVAGAVAYNVSQPKVYEATATGLRHGRRVRQRRPTRPSPTRSPRRR